MTDATGTSGWSEAWSFNTMGLTAVDDEEDVEIPLVFSLSQNYPNPFNPTTVIRYSLPSKAFVTMEVYNVLGEKVMVLVNEEKEAGQYSVRMDAHGLSSGLYFYRLVADQFVETRKFVLLK
jgi:hypothetical protein